MLWEVQIIANHYHPAVRAAAREVATMPLAGAVAPALGSHAPSELARLHSTTRGNFRPAIPPPPARKKAKLSPLDRAAARGEASRAAMCQIGEDLKRFVMGAERDFGESRIVKARKKNQRDGTSVGQTKRKGTFDAARALKRHFAQTSLFAAHAKLRREAARAARLARRARQAAEERAAAARAKKKASGKKKATVLSIDAGIKKKKAKK